MPRPFPYNPGNAESAAPAPRLVGWKDIATYLGKSERTVKRWGRDRNLPVHRVPGGASASVYAYPAELDKWLAAGNFSEPEIAAPSQEPDSSADENAAPAGAAGLPSPHAPDQAAPSHGLNPAWRWATAVLVLLVVAVAFSTAHFRASGISVPEKVRSLFAKKLPNTDLPVALTVSDSEKEQARGFYLKGRYEWNQRTPESLSRALDFFTQAIVHDPGYAQAYAGLSDTYDLLREYSITPENDVFPRAIAAARKAVALDDSLPEAHRALAFAEMYGSWDFVDAEKEFHRAIELNPNDAQAHRWYANAFAVPGRFAQSLNEIDKAQELDPSSNATLADKGYMLYNAGRPEEAIELLKEVERSAPEFRSPHFCLMVIGLDRKDYSAFLAEGQKTAEIVRDPVLTDIVAAARAGYAKDRGRGLMNRLYEKQKEYYLQGKLEGTMLAKTCALMGRRQEAIELLQEAYRRHEANVFACLSHPDLLTLKDEPGYAALVKKINFPARPAAGSPNYSAGAKKESAQTLSTTN